MTALLEAALPTPAPTPQLHLRLVRQAVPEVQRLTGKSVAKIALELALKVPLQEALARAVVQLAEKGTLTPEQVERMVGLAMKLVNEGLRLDDAVTIALHEPVHFKPSVPLPQAIKNALFPPNLNGQNVLKAALELNHAGTKMDDAIVAALKQIAGPRAFSQELADAVLAAAHELFKDGRTAADALDLALERTLPKHAR